MKNRTFTGILCRFVALVLFLTAGQAVAQNSMRLQETGTGRNRIEVEVGQTVSLEVFADLGNVGASGITVWVTVPAEFFLVVDQLPVDISQVDDIADTTLLGGTGTQPMKAGPLFAGAGEQRNVHHAAGELTGVPDDVKVLQYELLLGIGSERSRTGKGVVGTFQLTPIKPVQNARIAILDNPNQETRITTPEGGERRFNSAPQGLEINVLGLELLDIPDVLLLPGEADSVQIGSLDQYVSNSLSDIGDLTWSYAPVNDSLEIVINPLDRVVRITPLFDWSGRHRVVWTAVDSGASRFFSGPPPSATEFSDIVVNNPPVFDVARGPDGVKRDSVTFAEDDHPFISGGTLEPSRAFRGRDLDLLVIDPDPGDRLDFAILSFNADPNVRGNEDQNSHELLLWSLPNFTGVDSVQILVQDEGRGRDTLRVIVTVTEVVDAPQFILADVNPRISRGSSKEYQFDELVRDVDTELDSLIFTFEDEFNGNFVVDTLRVNGKKVVRVTGNATFTGTGSVSMEIADPVNPDLSDSIILFFTSADALPPDVLPIDLKIDLVPGGAREVIPLDAVVEDPDNDDDELIWRVPPITQSNITVDQIRQLLVQAPSDFIGFEAVELIVSDPSGQTDILPLRIYSSDGTPVAGGIPDVVLEKGEENRETDLDNYYFDSDNIDEEVQWSAVNLQGQPFDSEHLQIGIDRLTHLITYFATDSDAFLTESVILRVTDPAGNVGIDTVQVSVISGDGPRPGDTFSISPPLPDLLQVVISEDPQEILDLDNHLQVSASADRDSIRWELTNPGRLNGLVLAPGSTKLFVFAPDGLPAGLDTIEVAATGPSGTKKTASTTIRYIEAGKELLLAQIPDVLFVVGNPLSGLNLNTFILDRETHPDSVMQWSFGLIGTETSILIRIDQDSLLTAFSTNIDSAQIVLTARNVQEGVTGRDTVRIFAIDAPTVQLQPLPQLFIEAGSEDSSIVLNNFIPADLDFTPSSSNWTISNQRITLPFIEPAVPHLLRLGTVANRVGVDTLTLSVDLGAGFRATGQLIATVIEPISDNALELRIMPNPANPEFITVIVMSRRQLESSPTVVFSFGTADSTVAVRQTEDDLDARGVLIWSGNVQIPAGASGTVSFAAQALTALGSSVTATASISIATAVAGKPVALKHGSVELSLPSGAVDQETRIMLRASGGGPVGGAQEELTLKTSIGMYPTGLALGRPAILRTSASLEPADGVYRRQNFRWNYIDRPGGVVVVDRLGEYAILTDLVAPEIELVSVFAERSELLVRVVDGGSGIRAEDVTLEVADRLIDAEPQAGDDRGGFFTWMMPADLLYSGGTAKAVITASDRAGNSSVRTFEFSGAPLPKALELGDSYPNPFNPETTIPFIIPDHDGIGIGTSGNVRLAVYSVTGQVVRVLADDKIDPGRHRISWDGRDAAGRRVSSGLYLYRLETESQTITKRMTLLK